MTGVSKNTITKLLIDLSSVCSAYQNKVLRNLPCKRLQLDEVWSFVGASKRTYPKKKEGKDVWTWTAICADTKLVPSWFVGSRDAECAKMFVDDIASRLSHRVQLTTDGHKPYLDAVEDAFGCEVDYAMLIKLYGSALEDQRRYSPAMCVGCDRHVVTGNPDRDHISTSYAERANMTIRMQMRRFTRLTNAFLKKFENHAHAIALHFMNYNFARIHQTIKSTPALRAGVTDRLWRIKDIVEWLEKTESSSN